MWNLRYARTSLDKYNAVGPADESSHFKHDGRKPSRVPGFVFSCVSSPQVSCPYRCECNSSVKIKKVSIIICNFPFVGRGTSEQHQRLLGVSYVFMSLVYTAMHWTPSV